MKMEILIVSERTTEMRKVAVNVIPRHGDYLDIMYFPFPQVSKVVLLPSTDTLAKLDPECKILSPEERTYIEAIVLVNHT